ncbi:hypothetical protein H8D40_02035, partial [Candidatus Bathyarchaeota archaeon]|nr:hypothetical protein [Candidatus Bathyarchaeota archaeon]
LLGRPIENRATAYAELEAQWYDRWTRNILEDEGQPVPEGEQLPVLVKHVWNPVRVSDVYEMAKAVAVLHGRGQGPIGGRLGKAWEMMGWDLAELEDEESE